MKFTCLSCGKSIEDRRSAARKYCSNSCVAIANSKKRERRKTSACEQCGKFFEHYLCEKGRFCSHSCYAIWRIGKPGPKSKGRDLFLVQCKYCGKTFEIIGSRVDKARYCSLGCAIKDRRKIPADARGFLSYFRISAAYRKWRQCIVRRDGNKSVFSGQTADLHVHHLVGLADIVRSIQLDWGRIANYNEFLSLMEANVKEMGNAITITGDEHRKLHKKEFIQSTNPNCAVVTGAQGQDGSYLLEFLLSKGYKVIGIIKARNGDAHDNIQHLLGNKNLILLDGDICDFGFILRVLWQYRPAEFYNLAAISFVPLSWEVPEMVLRVNCQAVIGILEAIRTVSPCTKFYQASTSEIYGNVEGNIFNEKTPMQPRSPYGTAKLGAFHFVKVSRESHGIFACNGILHNHESPRRPIDFVTRKITISVARIRLGLQESVSLGNLNAKRDWGFAGDYIQAMWLMLQQEVPDDFVIATGSAHSVREFVETAFKCIGMKISWKGSGLGETGVDEKGIVRVKIDSRFYRPAEVNHLCGDASKAKRILGWEPETSFEELVSRMVQMDLMREKK